MVRLGWKLLEETGLDEGAVITPSDWTTEMAWRAGGWRNNVEVVDRLKGSTVEGKGEATTGGDGEGDGEAELVRSSAANRPWVKDGPPGDSVTRIMTR